MKQYKVTVKLPESKDELIKAVRRVWAKIDRALEETASEVANKIKQGVRNNDGR